MDEQIVQTKNNVIDLDKICRMIKARKKLFFITLPIALVLSSIYILSKPRFYNCKVKLAPEVNNPASGGALSSLASSFGFDIGSMVSTDAISPELYPDLLESTDFVVSLFPIKVQTEDGKLRTDYYTYLSKYQKVPWWMHILVWVKQLFSSDKSALGGTKNVNPFQLTKKQNKVVLAIGSNIKCSVDKKTNVITIDVTDQDKLICATMADSVRARLQQFITNYRTNKARVDLAYYETLTREAKQDYEKARQLYGSYADANTDIVLESFKAKQEDLENDMQLKYNTYNAMNTQMQAAKAKVQERTPAFTILQDASVPLKPAGPKRILFVLGMLILTFIGTAFYIVRKELHFEF